MHTDIGDGVCVFVCSYEAWQSVRGVGGYTAIAATSAALILQCGIAQRVYMQHIQYSILEA